MPRQDPIGSSSTRPQASSAVTGTGAGSACVPTKYTRAAAKLVALEVFDLSGRLVATIVDGQKPAGRSSVVWNGRDGRGQAVASGVYAYRFMVEGERALTRKMVLLK